jgi:hypothetical protein
MDIISTLHTANEKTKKRLYTVLTIVYEKDYVKRQRPLNTYGNLRKFTTHT